MKTFSGTCLCKKVSYQIKGELGPIINCHCSQCRRWHGAAFRTRCSVRRDHFRWLQGEEYITKYLFSEETTHTFCSICGSNLISFSSKDPDYIGFPVCALDQDPGHYPIMHIFVSSKSPCFNITDDLPQYDEWPLYGKDCLEKIEKE